MNEIKEAIEKNDIQTLIKYKKKLLSMLKSPNAEIRKLGWTGVRYIVETGNSVKLESNKGYLRSLLWHKLQGIRDDAWRNLDIYKELLVEGIERTLTASSDRIKWPAWSNVLKLIDLNLVPRDYVIKVRNSFWRLLRSRYGTIRKKAWRLFVELVKSGIFSTKDKYRFFDFLKHSRPKVRLYAWSSVPKLLELNFLTKDDIKNNLKYLQEMCEMKGSVGNRAKNILEVIKKLIE
ncbi:MAG: hypothetical protein QXV69_04895 [Sulfolobaceae archaeon]